MGKKIISLFLIAAVLLLSGCAKQAPESDEAVDPGVINDDPAVIPEEPETAKYEFDPHLYVPIVSDDVPQDYWDSFYNLCDALRAGETTFECSSEEAYKWATDPATLNELFPAACTKIKGESSDGSTPFENGVGRIYYQVPIDEYVERQEQFEELVTDVLNTYLEPDDDEFEKCLKLYDYMESNYSYEYEFVENKVDGASYTTIMIKQGQCVDLSTVYAYFLLQAGVEALQVGCSDTSMAHAWTYIVIDGKGYHSDPTWSLKSTLGGDELYLYYFMMTGERRANSGCPVDDLTAPLLPKYWANFSSADFTAEDEKYSFPNDAFLKSIDEETKTVHYMCDGEECQLNYA